MSSVYFPLFFINHIFSLVIGHQKLKHKKLVLGGYLTNGNGIKKAIPVVQQELL
jgi:hypothetical protein